MFARILRALAFATATLALLFTAPAVNTAGAAPSIKTAVPTVVTAGASGGGTGCVSAGSLGQFCSSIYQGTSRAGWVYNQTNLSSTSPTVSSASSTTSLCKVDTYGRNYSCQLQSFVNTNGTNYRPRCAVIRGGPTYNSPCRINGLSYSLTAGQRYRSTSKLSALGTSWTANSPILTAGS